MAKKQSVALDTNTEVVEDLHAVQADDGVEFTDVTGKDDLPPGVSDPAEEEEVAPAPKGKPTKAAKPDGEDLPEELKGKTAAQIAKMYRDAQQVIGRQGTELGELRRSADKFIMATLDKAAKPTDKPAAETKPAPDDVDFFTNPKLAIQQAVEQHPAIVELRGKEKEYAVREMTRQRADASERFHKAHPDAREIVQDPEFQAWVEKSPIRKAMILRAHEHYDLAAGNEVFSSWKELKAARTPPPSPNPDEGKPAAGRPAAKPAAQAARVPTGGNAAPRTSGTGGKEGKIFRRADVIRLMETDPARYELMSDEITKAYQEGRVR